MAFNGSGTFIRVRNWVQDAAAGIKIRADRHDTEDDNFAAGLSQCITKDGQTTITANLPMAGYKHTNVAAASNATDYAQFGQVATGKVAWADAGGTADAITASYSVPFTSLVDGMMCCFRASAANTTTTPTFSPDGFTARTIVRDGGGALVAGDIAGDGFEAILRYDLTNTRWELLNPAQITSAMLTNKTITNPTISGGSANNMAIGASTPSTGAFTTLTTTGDATVGQSAYNGLRYLNVYNNDATSGASGSIFRLISRNVANSADVPVNMVKYKNGSFIIQNTETDSSAFIQFLLGLSTQALRLLSTGAILTGSATSAQAGYTSQGDITANNVYSGTNLKYKINFNGTGTPAARTSFNISSITDNGTGNYTLNFTNSVPADTVPVGNAALDNTGGTFGRLNRVSFTDIGTTSIKVLVTDEGSSAEDAALITVMGA